MKEITLHRKTLSGLNLTMSTYVDDDDFNFICQWGWRLQITKQTCYAYRRQYIGKNKSLTIYMHREIMGLSPQDEKMIDHINGDGLLNIKTNLRIVNHQQNIMNKRRGSNNTSGFKGIYYSKRDKAWIAEIKHNYRKVYIGFFRDPQQAAMAYDKKAVELFGEYARINFEKQADAILRNAGRGDLVR